MRHAPHTSTNLSSRTMVPSLMAVLTFRQRATVWLWLIEPPALTFVLIFILDLLLMDVDVKIERRRRALGFEAGNHRRSPIQAGSGRPKTHRREIFLLANAIGAIAAALDYVYNRRALIKIFPRKGTTRWILPLRASRNYCSIGAMATRRLSTA